MLLTVKLINNIRRHEIDVSASRWLRRHNQPKIMFQIEISSYGDRRVVGVFYWNIGGVL